MYQYISSPNDLKTSKNTFLQETKIKKSNVQKFTRKLVLTPTTYRQIYIFLCVFFIT